MLRQQCGLNVRGNSNLVFQPRLFERFSIELSHFVSPSLPHQLQQEGASVHESPLTYNLILLEFEEEDTREAEGLSSRWESQESGSVRSRHRQDLRHVVTGDDQLFGVKFNVREHPDSIHSLNGAPSTDDPGSWTVEDGILGIITRERFGIMAHPRFGASVKECRDFFSCHGPTLNAVTRFVALGRVPIKSSTIPRRSGRTGTSEYSCRAR